jgi:hypothetical protein
LLLVDVAGSTKAGNLRLAADYFRLWHEATYCRRAI